MLDIITGAGNFITIIILGYVLRRIGVFKKEDFHVLSKITIRITLSASIIVSFSTMELDYSMLILPLLGLGAGLIYIGLAFLLNLHSPKEKKAFDILNFSGYNIGCFTMPFAQNFLGSVGVVTTSLFDAGNAFISLGGSFGIAQMIKRGSAFSFKKLTKALLKSPPFVCYILMTIISISGFSLPAPVVSCANTIAKANAFMAMFMIGVGFELSNQPGCLKTLIKILIVRYSVATILASIFYFLLPFSLEVRQALVILAFSPIGSAVPGFTNEIEGDVGLSSAINSMTILCSVIINIVLFAVML